MRRISAKNNFDASAFFGKTRLTGYWENPYISQRQLEISDGERNRHMEFDNLPTATQAALVDYYLMGASPHQEAPPSWLAERFFRTLDATDLAIWAGKLP